MLFRRIDKVSRRRVVRLATAEISDGGAGENPPSDAGNNPSVAGGVDQPLEDGGYYRKPISVDINTFYYT